MREQEQKILALLRRHARRSLTRREIAERLKLRGAERKQLTNQLSQLVRSGLLEERKGNYRLAPEQQKLDGTFSQAEQGYGFLRLDDETQEDLFIPARYVGSAMDGDRVQVGCRYSTRDRRPYAQVLNVVQRAHGSMLGVYGRQRGRAWVIPLNTKIAKNVYVQAGGSLQAEPGQVVKLEFDRYPTATAAGSGRVVEVLGDQDDPQVDIETVIRGHELPKEFSAEVLEEAAAVAIELSADDFAGRTDLRQLPLMTIDGETAKDFDDAVALCREPDGNNRLWVCIADVAHYVAAGGALDKTALERGTSVYFPGHCLPMLPESLSNGICSLIPHEDRLVMTAEMLFDQSGKRLAAEFYPAVICSRARLTYNQVAAFLAGAEDIDMPAEIEEQLPNMARLAEILGEMRRQRGSLELDVPDVEIELDDSGFPRSVSKTERTMAHRLIEEFMLAANETVAEFLEKRHYQFLYRIHEPPTADKLQDFQQLAAECGVGLVLKKNLQQELQRLLEEVAGRPEARLLNQQLLRSLQQARYTPIKKGHFGLAAECYCHFTSPIRRYPDLQVHRTLKKALQQGRKEAGAVSETLVSLGQECSDKERRAMAAERDLLELRRCQLLKDQLGEQFAGTISSVTEFGFFVELNDLFIEGLVHVRSLDGDYYSFDPTSHTLIGERRRKEFRVGMQVVIRVEKVELWRRRIDFALVESL